MSRTSIPDVLGPITVAVNGGPEIPLRSRVRFGNGLRIRDDRLHARTQVLFDAGVWRTVTASDAALHSASHLAEVENLSTAHLVRLANMSAETVLYGLVDVQYLSTEYYSLQAVPDRTVKFVANTGNYRITLQPPAAVLDDPDTAGIFLDAVTLNPNDVVRVFWDQEAGGYRIMGGSHGYIVVGGRYVVHEGRRIYRRT